MPVHFSWDNPEHTIVRYDFVDKWTWEELYETFHKSWGEIVKLPYVVDSISDFARTNHAPPSVMTHVRKLSQSRPANTGTMVMVDANSFLTMMFQTFSKLFHTTLRRELNIQAVKTLEEGRALLAKIQSERDKQE
jgi:hypothetical protein